MHNIDRTLQEFENGPATAGEFAPYEATGEYGQELEAGQALNGATGELEALVGELAQELREVGTAQELNQFLGNLLGQAAGTASKLLASPAGQSVGRYLVQVGKQTLPQLAAQAGQRAGATLGSRLGAPLARAGGWAGSQAGQWAGTQAGNWLADNAQRVFGLELEMLSPEQQELEISRAYVCFATDVARRAERTLRRYPQLGLGALGRQVLGASAPRYAPGLLGDAATRPCRGTWVRRGSTIVLYGA